MADLPIVERGVQVRWKVRQQPREEPKPPPPKMSGAASLRSPGVDMGDPSQRPRAVLRALHVARSTSCVVRHML